MPLQRCKLGPLGLQWPCRFCIIDLFIAARLFTARYLQILLRLFYVALLVFQKKRQHLHAVHVVQVCPVVALLFQYGFQLTDEVVHIEILIALVGLGVCAVAVCRCSRCLDLFIAPLAFLHMCLNYVLREKTTKT